MAALVAYPVASQHDRASGRQRTPQSRTGWDEVGYGDVSQELIFKIACNYLQNAVLHMFSERCELSGGRDNLTSSSSTSQRTCKRKDLRLPSTLPSITKRHESQCESQLDCTTTDARACPSVSLPLQLPSSPGKPRPRSARANEPFPVISPEVDFFTLHNVRSHAKKKKKATTSAFSWDDNEKKEEEGTAEGGEGGAAGGAGGSGGGASGGAGGDDGNGGDEKGGDDDWDDWSGAKKNKKKTKKKQDEEEEEEEKPKEKDDWAGVGGEDEWDGWGAAKGKKKTDKKTEDDPAASTSAWADTGGAGGEDDDWAGFASGGKKKKNKKKQSDDPAKPADEGFHEINLGDEGDLGAPKISLSFDEPAPAKKEEPASSGFGFGGWGSSWSFGGLAGKKEEDKDKNGEKSPGSGGFWGKSSLSDFNFGFGANTDGKSLDIGDSKKQADDEDDFLPAWGGGASSTKKGADKKSKFGIEEVDDPPPPPKAGDDTWGGWGKKTTTSKKDTAPTDSWSGSGSGWGASTTASSAKKDKKKTGASWADLMEEEDETTALPSIKDDKKTDDSWGMWGTKTKDTKKADDDIWGGFESGSKKKDGKAVIEEVKEDDLSVLKGLTCEKDGMILDNDGNPIGELYEGDAAIISRRLYLCSEKGEFKDKKFKVIGKARLLPKDPPADTSGNDASADAVDADAPPLSALEGLCCERDGTIKDYSGKVIGQVIEGDAAEFSSKMYFCGSDGTIRDYKDNSVGKAKTIGSGKPKDGKAKDDDIWGWAAKSKVPPPPKGAAKGDKKDDKKSDDIWGSFGKKDKVVEEEKPAEKSDGDLPPLSILLDRTVDADGKVYDDDNIPIGECVEGDISTIARRKYKIDGEGNVMSRLGKVLGKCVVLPSANKDAAAEPEPEPEPMIEEVKEPEAAAEPPPLSTLKGRTVESDGTILNADGDVIGEVTEGDPERFASIAAKCDGNGNILNSKKKAVGKCKTVAPQSVPVTEAPSEAPVEDAPAAEETSKSKFTLADLMGRKIESNGDILDDDFNPIAKVIDGNAKQLAKKGALCDAEGNIVLGKKTLGKVELLEPAVSEEVPAEAEPPPEEEAPATEESKPSAKGLTLASLEGRFVEADGNVLDDDGNVIARVIDGKPKQMAKKKATCDANGNVVFGFSTMGTVELVMPEGGSEEAPAPEDAAPPPPPVEDEPAQVEAPTLASLAGRPIEKNGDILDDNGEVIGRLVAGSASKLYKGGAKCDGEGNVLMKSKIQKDAKVELVLPEKTDEPEAVEDPPVEPEPEPVAEEANPFAKLEGLKIEKNGDILDAQGDLVALLVGGSASKLYKAGATLDAEGRVFAKGKEVKDAKIELIEAEKKDEDPVTEDPPIVHDAPPLPPAESPFAQLDGRKMEKNGDILDDDGNVLAVVSGGSLSKLYKAGATCDAEGKLWSKGKEVKDVNVELVQPPEPEEPPPPPEAPKEPEKPSFASIDGKLLDKFGEVYSDDNVLVARLIEGSAGTLYKKGAYCDAEGNVLVNGKKQKAKMELVVLEDPPEPEPEPVAPAIEASPKEEEQSADSGGRTLAYLEGAAIDISGDIFDDDGTVIGKLVEGSATKLYAKFATCTADGKVEANGKIQKGARVELVEAEKGADLEAEAEAPPPPPPAAKPLTLEDLDGLGFDEDGNVINNDGVIVGKLVGEMKKLSAIRAAKGTCASDGTVWAKGKKVPKVTVEVVQPEPPTEAEPIADAEPEPEVPAEPEPEGPSLAILDGRAVDKSGDIYDDDMKVIGRLVEGDAKKLAKQAATCDAEGGVWAKKKRVSGARVELVLAEPPAEPEPEPEPEPEAVPEPPTLASLEGRTLEENGDILDDNGAVVGKLVDGLDKLKLLVKNKATCDGEGKVFAKGKQVPRARVEVVVPDPPPADEGKNAVNDLLDSIDNPDTTWGDPWAATGLSKTDSKKKRDSFAISPTADDRALTRINTKSSKASASKDDDWGDWLGGKKDKKKDDPMIIKAEAVDEPDAEKKDEDTFGFAFTNKKKTTKKKGLVEAVDDFDTPTQKAETIEEQKSSGQEDSDWAFASNRVKAKKAAVKSGTTPKSSLKAIEAPAPPEDDEPAPEDDGIAPDDSASVYKEPVKKKDEKSKASSMWGGIFGAKSSSSSKTPALSQLRKEREEREKKEREEREEQERIEREQAEAEQAERERIEQEERDKALREAEKAQKSSKKSSKKLAKTKTEELPPPPPPPPAAAAFDDFDLGLDESNDPFAKWGVKRKPVKSTNEKSSLTADAKKSLETAGDEVLPIDNGKAAVASSSSKAGIKSSSKLKTGSIADRIKALQGETKLKDDSALAPPVPPPPPAVPPVDTKDLVPESSSKKSRKLATSSKSAKLSKREPEPEPEPAIKTTKGKGFAIGGFPDSDDDLLIDLEDSKPPTPPPEPDMGAQGLSKSGKKLSSKSASKSSKTLTKSSKAKPVKKAESGSETEAEPEDKAVTQGSGSTTAVDDQHATDGKLPTPPPDLEKRKSSSPTARKERPKVVRGSTGAAWGFWGTSGAPKDARPRTKDISATPMAIRTRAPRKSVPTDPEKSENEKKMSSKPTPKRASTFSIFSPAPATRRQSTRSTRRPSSRPQSGRASPEMTGVENDDDVDEVPRVSSKAAKLMGMNPGAGASASRRASTKSKGETSEIAPYQASLHTSPQDQEVDTQQQAGRSKDPYALPSDDEDNEIDELPENGNDIYAVDSPAAPTKARRSKRRSAAEASASVNQDDPLAGEDPSLDGARALGADTREPPTSRRHSPSTRTRRSISRSIPQQAAAVGGIMGLFGALRRSNTTKETPRDSDPSFAGGRSRGAGYETDAGYRRSSKRSNDDDDSAARRDRRERRKSRRDGDDGFTTDAAGAQTDYEQAERRRAERREARRAEKERNADQAREAEERDPRRRDRDGDKEARRAARRERDEARIAEEVEKRRRAEKEERRAARKAKEDDRLRQEEQTRADEEARTAKDERRARRRAEREAKDVDAERPRGERRKSSYMDGAEDAKHRSSRRDSRRLSKAGPVDGYFDSRNGQNGASPYFGGPGGDKTSSWVDSVNREPPAPLQPEDTATVIEAAPEDEAEHDGESEEEIRRRMHGRRERRAAREHDSGEVRETRDDRDREDRRRERRRRDRGEKTSDPDVEKDRRRRSSYYPEPNHPYPDYDVAERPQAPKRQSWLKKIPINNLF